MATSSAEPLSDLAPSAPLGPPTSPGLETWTQAARVLVDRRLADLLPTAQGGAGILASAVRDACLARGKRVRPILALLAAAQFGGDWRRALDFACAVEMVHAASLILDDLPCMDDAALRRGRPALHRTFGEDAAVLSAVALLNHAYGVLARDSCLSAATRLTLQLRLSEAVGLDGLTGGQMRDLRDPEAARNERNLTSLNHQKTGVLFVAAVGGGALIAGAGEAALTAAGVFADRLGFAFQLLDDLHDVTGLVHATGKDAGQDAKRTTFASLWGVERLHAAIAAALQQATGAFADGEDGKGEPSLLAGFARGLFRHAGYSL